MQNPRTQITQVVTLITSTVSPDIQRASIYKYFTQDAGFRHPLCSIAPGLNSRESLLGVYQWYRVMSPHIDLTVHSVVYDPNQNTMILDIEQYFHIRLNPFEPTPSRLTVRLHLREESGLHYIAFQEDFYHPDDLISLVIPPLAPLVRLLLESAGVVYNISARLASVVGFWRVGGAVKQD